MPILRPSHHSTTVSFECASTDLHPRKTEFVKVMATLGDGPYAMNDIAKILGKKLSSLGPVRANTISKGMIYSTEHGFLDFSVPLFAEFMRRQP